MLHGLGTTIVSWSSALGRVAGRSRPPGAKFLPSSAFAARFPAARGRLRAQPV
jgi:hypothetical protein